MIEAASGIDVIKLTVDAFEGKEVDVRPSFYPGVVVNEFIYCSEGVFDHMENVEECLDNGLLLSLIHIFLISHRVTTLMSADKIMVLNQGRIEEMGTHQELIKQQGIYRKIYDIQMSQDDRMQMEV